MANKQAKLHTYVLCGGSGTRLWPLSNATLPKQFHRLHSHQTLFEDTLVRLGKLEPAVLRVIASTKHTNIVQELSAEAGLGPRDLLFEPKSRNTAAAVALATHDALRSGDNPLLLVAPSDHLIKPDTEFEQCVRHAIAHIDQNDLILFGIRPHRAETGYGYIKTGKARDLFYDIKYFNEKPEQKTASKLVESKNVFWNSGIFLFRARAMAKRFETLQPALWHLVGQSLSSQRRNDEAIEVCPKIYPTIAALPFDTAIVEKTHSLKMVEATFDWSDIGSWKSVHENGVSEGNNNVVSGGIAQNCSNTLISGNGIRVAAQGVDDLAVIATPDVVYVARLSQAHRVGELRERAVNFEPASPVPAQTKIDTWLHTKALPFWAENSVDWLHGGFHERLALNGQPIHANKRLRTMARQTWAFAEAARRTGNSEYKRIALHGFSLLSTTAQTSNGNFAKVFSPSGAIIDGIPRPYDLAMVLLACAGMMDFAETESRAMGNMVISLMKTGLEESASSPRNRNKASFSPGPTTNAYMHMLDALNDWHAKTSDPIAMELITVIWSKFESELFCSSDRVALEVPPLSPTKQDGQFWSPGHHFEWIHLLLNKRDRSQKDVRIARQLWAMAQAFGINPVSGLARLKVSLDGSALVENSRSWAQYEAVRAAIALRSLGLPDFDEQSERLVKNLFKFHLDPAPAGGWLDETDRLGYPLSTDMPTSIFYHMVRSMYAFLDGAVGGAVPHEEVIA